MNKKVKNISQEIRSGKLLEENIPQLFNYLADHYYSYSGVRLAMHYFAFYEAYLDDEETWSAEAKATLTLLNGIIKENILNRHNGEEREKAVRRVDDIRKKIGSRMNMLTAYTDIFQTYEYVLNRLEYRFMEELEPVDEEEFSKEILRYIFANEDNFVINEKIKEIIGQLPIRITKQKYFDLIQDSLQAYLGSDLSSLQTYLYMLRTAAMLYREEGMDTCYPELAKKMEHLAEIDYKNISKEGYDKAVSTLQVATLILETETTLYFGLQEITNEVYAMLLCSNYAGMVENDTLAAVNAAVNAATNIIREINNIFTTNEKKELTEELMEKFSDIEGIQEEISYDLTILEDALYEVDHTHSALANSMLQGPLLQILLRSQKLLSNSLFIDLEDQPEDVTVDEDIIRKEIKALTQELTDMFAKQDKIITRAVIANTINKMPVFFKDHKEVMDYVCYSFERCSDSSEKAACTWIINTLMSE